MAVDQSVYFTWGLKAMEFVLLFLFLPVIEHAVLTNKSIQWKPRRFGPKLALPRSPYR